MKLTILTDNNTIIDRYLLGEPAVSYYLEDGDKRILFDCGYSDVYVKNAEKLGIDLQKTDAVVLSHGHDDHTGGIGSFPTGTKKPLLVGHADVLEKKRMGSLSICSPMGETELALRFRLSLSAAPQKISEHLLFLGEIPRHNDFENQQPIGERFCDGQWQPDYLKDDSALVYLGENSISLITGCSHAGICNMIAYARQLTGIDRVEHVIGGFHLMDEHSDQLRRTAEYLQRAAIPHLYPCHCTSFACRAAIHRLMPVQEVGAGDSFCW